MDAAELALRLDRLGPFEPQPLLAVAVSGGADSLALTLLAAAWARSRGGTVTALTVDHGLRPASAAEAARVAAWLAPHGIAHHCLAWRGPHPRRGVQAAARAARYRLLEAWCAAAGCLHLLTAHHREDQAETFLIRLARGSGLDGLAAMAPVVERTSCRVLRPLLGVPRARLAATLTAAGQDWIEDPSNRDPAFARVRLRRAAALLEGEGLGAARLAETATRLGRSRAALEAAVDGLLARSVALDPAGFAELDAAALAAAPLEIGLRALAALLATIGGAEYGPRLERLERLHGALVRGGLGRGRTLAGCRLVPRRGRVLICREPDAVAPPLAIAIGPGVPQRWDGRFRVCATVPQVAAGAPVESDEVQSDAAGSDGARGESAWSVGALGAAALPRDRAVRSRAFPAVARAGLPALYRGGRVVALLPFGGAPAPVELCFRPTRPLTSAGFTVV